MRFESKLESMTRFQKHDNGVFKAGMQNRKVGMIGLSFEFQSQRSSE